MLYSGFFFGSVLQNTEFILLTMTVKKTGDATLYNYEAVYTRYYTFMNL